MRFAATVAVLAVALPGAVAFAPVEDLAKAQWIGDGRPERNGADWYEEDPAPEFCAEFTLPEGVTNAQIHFACAGFAWYVFSAFGFYPLDPVMSSPRRGR